MGVELVARTIKIAVFITRQGMGALGKKQERGRPRVIENIHSNLVQNSSVVVENGHVDKRMEGEEDMTDP